MAIAPMTYRQLMKGKAKGKPLYELRRGSAAKRGYGSRWRKLAKAILARDPICKHPGCEQPSTDADHIIPKPEGEDSMENGQGLCHSHHSRKTVIEDGGFGR